MQEYNICGEKVVISTQVENERYIIENTEPLIDRVGSIFDNWYSSQRSCEAMIKDIDSVTSKAIHPLNQRCVEILNQQNVFTLDEKHFFYGYTNALETFDETIAAIAGKIDEINGQRELEKQYRQLRKDTRTRMVGGGYTVGGAIKGMAKAGTVNAMTGMAYSMKNAIGNMGSSISASVSKDALMKDAKAHLREALIMDAYNVQDGLRIALEREAGIKCKPVTESDYNQAQSIIQSCAAGKIPLSQKKGQLIKALLLNPYKDEIYDLLWDQYGDQNGELRKMASFFGSSLSQRIAKKAENYGDEIFSKNCAPYLNAFNKLAAAIQCEQGIKKTLAILREYCQTHDLETNMVPTIGLCEHLLGEVEITLRTAHGQIYDSRKTAAAVENDYKLFYRTLAGKDVFDGQTYFIAKKADYASEEFKSMFESIYAEEQTRRNPEKVFENIYKILRENLGDGILQQGWIDVPGRLGSLEAKLGSLQKVSPMEPGEVPLVLFNKSSDGKRGVLFTGTNIRIFSKELFAKVFQTSSIDQVEKIECTGADEYTFHIEFKDDVKFSFDKKNLQVQDQINLGEAMSQIAELLCNIRPKDRQYDFSNRNAGGTAHESQTDQAAPLTEAGQASTITAESKPGEVMILCPGCQKQIPVGIKFCNYCGTKNIERIACFKCGKMIEKDIKFCNFCGAKNVEHIACSSCGKMIEKGIKFCNFCGEKQINTGE